MPELAAARPRARYTIPWVKVLAVFQEPDGRWYVSLAGSWESLCLGHDHPGFRVGDMVKITLEHA
jgi:hypothetical protein